MKKNITNFVLIYLVISLITIPAISQTASQYNAHVFPILIPGTIDQEILNVSSGVDEISTTVPASATLPVKYLSFDAITSDKAVKLLWVTGTEMDNGYIEVERSFDRTNFKTIAIALDGFSRADNNKTYQYNDNADKLKSKTVIFYRLKYVGPDNTIGYSEILAVQYENGFNKLKPGIYVHS